MAAGGGESVAGATVGNEDTRAGWPWPVPVVAFALLPPTGAGTGPADSPWCVMRTGGRFGAGATYDLEEGG